ncbi:ImmA/IrrE family metallo-endopeptidase [Solibacillus silvestris]|uniref:ImmA/IrrE family metallo-endopeptidase n=1 Tax=Solibacillus silvestris TaxID=76853 RepID=UPI003F7D32C2
MSNYVADPLSRKKIRVLANRLRQLAGLKVGDYFDVVRFLEYELYDLVPDFSHLIMPFEQMGNQYAVTYPETKTIVISEDVYERAIEGSPRDRFTIAHEIGHLWLHRPGKIALARASIRESIPPYKDPEWQANTFAGEILLPPESTIGLSVDEIVNRFGVSYQVGIIQINNR